MEDKLEKKVVLTEEQRQELLEKLARVRKASRKLANASIPRPETMRRRITI